MSANFAVKISFKRFHISTPEKMYYKISINSLILNEY